MVGPDAPPAGMADYVAAKAALAAGLTAVRRDRRRTGASVLDIRLPHVELGSAARRVVGEPPHLPRGLTVDEAADGIVPDPIGQQGRG